MIINGQTSFAIAHTYFTVTGNVYTPRLTVHDSIGRTNANAAHTVTVKAGTDPIARFTVSPTSGDRRCVGHLRRRGIDRVPRGSRAARHPCEDHQFYQWDFGDGSAIVTTAAPTTSTTHSYAATGTYTIRLTVIDTDGLTAATTHTLLVPVSGRQQRIDDLRRRVQKDPASIAFAQLAEECRRAGHYEEAVNVCRAGLELHPGYLSARVTLGRALIELNQLDEALAELEHVLKSAPENLAAIRGLAEIHHRQGTLARGARAVPRGAGAGAQRSRSAADRRRARAAGGAAAAAGVRRRPVVRAGPERVPEESGAARAGAGPSRRCRSPRPSRSLK